MAERTGDFAQSVAFACQCGKRWSQPMKHYERVRCSCGSFFWVLQPRRDGPFKSFPWTPPINPHECTVSSES